MRPLKDNFQTLCRHYNSLQKCLLLLLQYSEYYEYKITVLQICCFSISFCGLEFLGARLYLTLLLQIVVKILLRCLFCQYIYPLLERQRATNWFQSLYTTLYSSDLALEVRKHVVSIFL